jgi:S1-C subfamily serine protease
MEGRMARRLVSAFLLAALIPASTQAVPRPAAPRLHPFRVAAEPSYVRRVQPAIVGLSVRADPAASSSARLGATRFASGVVFDPRGYAVTVTYALLDAVAVEARTHDGRTVHARVVGLDLESGLGVVKLEGPGPWPAAALGDSRDVRAEALTGTVSVDEDNEPVWVVGVVQGIRRFSGFWEYMLDRAFLIAPGSASWGGAAVVDEAGRVVAIASLRLGEPPHVNLAIPLETFLPVKDELIAAGRAVSRRARPWLGLYTHATREGVFVDDFAPAGPARGAGFRKGDRIVSVNGAGVVSQEEFYEALWRGRAGDVIRVGVLRGAQPLVIAVRSIDRYRLIAPPR